MIAARQQHLDALQRGKLDRILRPSWQVQRARSNEEELLPEQRLQTRALDRPETVDQRHVEPAGDDQLAQHVAETVADVQHNVRMLVRERKQQGPRKIGGGAEGGEANRDMSLQGSGRPRYVALGLLQLLQHRLGVAIQSEAGFRRRDPMIAAQEQFLLEMRLERGDLLAQRRLRDAQRVCGARHAARVDDLDEAAQFLEVDAHALPQACRRIALRTQRQATGDGGLPQTDRTRTAQRFTWRSLPGSSISDIRSARRSLPPSV